MAWNHVAAITLDTKTNSAMSAENATPVYSPTLSHSSDGKFLCCPCTDGWVRFYDRTQLSPVVALHGLGNEAVPPPRGIYHSCFGNILPSLIFIQTPNDTVARGWDLRTQKVEIELNHQHPVTSLGLGVDDLCLVSGTTSGITLWDIRNPLQASSFNLQSQTLPLPSKKSQKAKRITAWEPEHDGAITTVTFSDYDSRLFMSADENGIVNVCDMTGKDQDSAILDTFNAEASVDYCAFFGDNHQNAIILTDDSKLFVFNIRRDDPAALDDGTDGAASSTAIPSSIPLSSSASSSTPFTTQQPPQESLMLRLKDARRYISITGQSTMPSAQPSFTPGALSSSLTQQPSGSAIADQVIMETQMDAAMGRVEKEDDNNEEQHLTETQKEAGYFGETITDPSQPLPFDPSQQFSTPLSAEEQLDWDTQNMPAHYLIGCHYDPPSHNLLLLSGRNDGSFHASSVQRSGLRLLFSFTGAHTESQIRAIDWLTNEPGTLFSSADDGKVVLWKYNS